MEGLPDELNVVRSWQNVSWPCVKLTEGLLATLKDDGSGWNVSRWHKKVDEVDGRSHGHTES